jgi:hypothetical protein
VTSAVQREVHRRFTELDIKHAIVRSVNDTAKILDYWGIATLERSKTA